jgi:hypothetical protein
LRGPEIRGHIIHRTNDAPGRKIASEMFVLFDKKKVTKNYGRSGELYVSETTEEKSTRRPDFFLTLKKFEAIITHVEGRTAHGIIAPLTDDGMRVERRAEFTILETNFRNDLPARKSGPEKFNDSVGLSGYRIDIHKPAKRGQSGSMTGSNHGKHWVQQIPLGALIPVRVENLLPACKGLGVTAVTNGAYRVHPTEWNIGESAGALAAFCL